MARQPSRPATPPSGQAQAGKTARQAGGSPDKRGHKLSHEQLISFYRKMQLIRRFEEKSAEQYTRGKIRGFLHLYIGEEAIAVGTMSALRPDDYIVTHYRDHGHALARGVDSRAIMAELYGKSGGTSRGKGGSMHIFDVSKSFMGGWAIVGGQLPMATGLALAAQYLKQSRISVVFFGDGALNQGEFHESLNLASLWKLPIVFYLENNLYGMGTHIDRTYAGGRDVFRAAAHYRIPARQVDGMDVLAVHQAVTEVAAHARSGEGPFFLEALTYRFRGHSMADPIQYRTDEELERWQKRDPVPTFRAYLLDGVASETELAQVDQSVEEEVEESIKFAEASPFPEPAELYKDIEAEASQ